MQNVFVKGSNFSMFGVKLAGNVAEFAADSNFIKILGKPVL